MRFQQELQQMLLAQSLPSTSHAVLVFLETYLLTALTNILTDLRYAVRHLALAPGTASNPSVTPPYDLLLLHIHLHDKARFYRLSSYLHWEEVRRKAKESAYGVSELEMPNEDDDPDKDPEDAWVSSEATPGNASGKAAKDAQRHLTYNSLSLFEEHALPLDDGNDGTLDPDRELQKMAATPGLIEHFKRLKAADLMTAKLSPSEYVQYTENRAQASFSHHKASSKRFRDFISPTLATLEIAYNEDLVDVLGFLAFEILTELVLQAKEEGRRRVSAIRAEEARVRKVEEARTAAKKRKLAAKKEREAAAEAEAEAEAETDAEATGSASKDGSRKRRLTADSLQEKEAKEAERRRKQQEDNLIPTGPFSAPPMQQASLITNNMECPGTVEAPGKRQSSLMPDGSKPSARTDAVKVDNTAPMADIASTFDLLLGDFELALHNNVRKGNLSTMHRRRGTRLVDKFR